MKEQLIQVNFIWVEDSYNRIASMHAKQKCRFLI